MVRFFLCLKDNYQIKNYEKSKPYYCCKGLHNSAICFQKDKKGDSPKFADEITQDEKTQSFENSHRCHVQSNVSLVMIQTAVVVL